MTAAAVKAPAWYQFGSADLVFLLLCVLIFQAARGKMLSDPGLGWHLRNIDAMRAKGGWLTVDPFSQPREGVQRPWYTNQWLGELPFWLGERWAGLEGVAAVATVLLALTLRLLYTSLLRDGLPWLWAVVWVCLAAVGTNCSWIARPNLFTMLFVFLTARLCEQFHLGRVSWRGLLWLCPLFAVWANTHGGFIAGFIFLGITLLGEFAFSLLAARPEERARARQRGIILGCLTVGAFLATLINPYGWRLYPWIFQLLGDPYFMNLHAEWKPTPLTGPGGYQFEFFILLLPLVLGLTQRRPTFIELGLAVAWLHFALTGFRYFPLWVLIAIPLMARSSFAIPWIERFFAGLQPAEAAGQEVEPATRPQWLWTFLFGTALFGGSFFLQGRFAHLLPNVIPTVALDKLVNRHQERPDALIFNSYDWGGYLTWHGWQPNGQPLLNWIDDRNEVQGQAHVREYFSILDAEPGWEEKLNRDRVELVCIEPGAQLARELKKQSSVTEWAALALAQGSPWFGAAIGGSLRLAGWRQVYPLFPGEGSDKDQATVPVIFERFLDKSH